MDPMDHLQAENEILRRENALLRQAILDAKEIAQRLKDTTVIIPSGEAM